MRRPTAAWPPWRRSAGSWHVAPGLWRHLWTLTPVPFSPRELRKQDADWHSRHKQSKRRGQQTDRQIYLLIPDTRMLAPPVSSGYTTECNPLSLWDLLRRTTCQSRRPGQKEAVGLAAVCWLWVRARLLPSLVQKLGSQVVVAQAERQGSKGPTSTAHNAASSCQWQRHCFLRGTRKIPVKSNSILKCRTRAGVRPQLRERETFWISFVLRIA